MTTTPPSVPGGTAASLPGTTAASFAGVAHVRVPGAHTLTVPAETHAYASGQLQSSVHAREQNPAPPAELCTQSPPEPQSFGLAHGSPKRPVPPEPASTPAAPHWFGNHT